MPLPRSLVRLALALLLFVTLPVAAKPALWVVHQGQSTVYLFGTVHLLPSDTDWRFPALQEALDDSDALYIEITDDNPVTMQALVLRYGLDLGQRLSDRLKPGDRKLLAAAARAAGLPGVEALQPMRPWLAAVTLAVAPLVKAGLNPRQGVDKQLKAQMLKAGKPVKGLETSATQIRYLASMPDKVQMDFLHSTLHDYGKAESQLRQLIDAWKAGDVATIARTADDEMRKESPVLYQRLIVKRNKNWAGIIAAMLKKPGTTFIAVGAAHLAGPDSVQHQLALKGIHAVRK